MVFKHEGWTLYTKNVNLKGGKKQTIYFFAKNKPKSGEPCDIPQGWEVMKAKASGSGMPYLRKK